MKKILSAILALSMVITLFNGVTVSAATITGTCGNNLTWTLDSNGLLTISGTGAMYSSPWNSRRNAINKVIISDGVTHIGGNAFYDCSSLASIVIPDSVTTIGSSAFYNCSSLASIVIPDSVTTIGSSAFANCDSLKSIKIPNGVASIEDDTFFECSALASIEIPDSLTSIGDNAFYRCRSLTSIKLPDDVNSIGERAFYVCTSLASINIPNSVTSIKEGTFVACSSLDSIKIPDSVTYIGAKAFEECSSLASIEIPNSVRGIGQYAFAYCDSLKSIEIPNGVAYISSYTFAYCYSLTDIIIPDSVISIGDNAFCACSSLTSIKIPNSVTSICEYAFYVCESLTSIEIPDSVTSIGRDVLMGCDALNNVYYDGTTEDWKNVTVHSYNNDLTNNLVYLHVLPKEPNCTENGNIEYWLGHNGIGYYEDKERTILIDNPIIPALEHEEIIDEAVAPTCTTTGLTEGKHCSRCDEVLIKQEFADKLAHSYGKWKKINDYDHSRNCECGDTQTELHYMDGGIVTTPATYTSTGIKTYSCTKCEMTITEVIPMITFTVSGTVKSFGDTTGYVKVDLIKNDSVVNTVTIQGNSGTYTFNEIIVGDYVIRVSKTKHAPREYAVTVTDADITQDVEIWLYGDVTSEGVINNIDVLHLNRKGAALSSVFDSGTEDLKEYKFKVANITSVFGTDKVINNIDVMQINRKIVYLSSVFDRIA